MEERNKPYVKMYDEKGGLINPIVGSYTHNNRNRKERRSGLSNKSFTGNQKGMSLIVSGKFRYKRVIQFTTNKLTGLRKSINHYLAV